MVAVTLSAEACAIPSPTGTTRLYAVVGHPVEQVQAPERMNRLFAERNVDAVLVAVKAEPSRLASVIEGLKAIANLEGILVTVPHKFAVCDHVDRLSETAALAQSANILRRERDGSWSADNFDGQGFLAGLHRAGHEVSDKTVCLVGAGGAGVSIGPALMTAGARHLFVTDISIERADALARRLDRKWPGRVQALPRPAVTESDIIVNATPLGLRPGDPMPFEVDELPERAVVADIVMKPADTKLLKAARSRGLRVHPGIHMLTEQIDMYREFFRIQ
jgi:shikimate dehydrogenase